MKKLERYKRAILNLSGNPECWSLINPEKAVSILMMNLDRAMKNKNQAEIFEALFDLAMVECVGNLIRKPQNLLETIEQKNNFAKIFKIFFRNHCSLFRVIEKNNIEKIKQELTKTIEAKEAELPEGFDAGILMMRLEKIKTAENIERFRHHLAENGIYL